jgi:hypothetical protein
VSTASGLQKANALLRRRCIAITGTGLKKPTNRASGHASCRKRYPISENLNVPASGQLLIGLTWAVRAIAGCTEAWMAAFMAAFLSKGPNLSRKIRHWLDDEEDVPRNEYELIECAAGSRLHLINRKNGDLLGSRHNDLIHDFKAENFFRSLLNQDSFRGHHGKS